MRRLLRLGPAQVRAGEDVEGDGQDLEAEEDDDEVVGHGHHHAARGRQQHEDVELGAVELLPPEVVVGQQGGEQHGGGDELTKKTLKRSTDRAPATAVKAPSWPTRSHRKTPARAVSRASATVKAA